MASDPNASISMQKSRQYQCWPAAIWQPRRPFRSNRAEWRASCIARTSLLPQHWIIPHIGLLFSPIYPVLGVPYLSHALLLPANPFPWCCVSILKMNEIVSQCQQRGRVSIPSLPIPLLLLFPFAMHLLVVMPTVLNESVVCVPNFRRKRRS